jgi:hypothetical protein
MISKPVMNTLVTPAPTFADGLWKAKQHLVANGYSVIGSGDGLAAYSAVGDVLASAADINDRAWFRLAHPDGQRETMIQAVTVAWPPKARIKYSYSAGFTGGSPSANRTPSATDEEMVKWGGGSDASPIGQGWWHFEGYNAGDYLWGAVETEAPYRFWFRSVPASAPASGGFCWIWDKVSVPAGFTDDDPYVWVMVNDNVSDVLAYVGSTRVYGDGPNAYGFYNKGGANEDWTNFANCLNYNSAYLGADPTGDYTLIPTDFTRRIDYAPTYASKGYSSMLLRVGQLDDATCVHLDVDGDARGWIKCMGYALPWDGSQISQPSAYGDAIGRVYLPDLLVEGGTQESYLMRGFDTTLGQTVYWSASQPDPTGTHYTGPGPVTSIVLV